jgi:hypothetical protein
MKFKTSLTFSPDLEGHPLFLSKSQEYFDLHPFFLFSPKEKEPELHFLHQEISSRVTYKGYGTHSFHMENELEDGILGSYQKVLISLRDFSLTTRVLASSNLWNTHLDAFIEFHLKNFVGRQEELRAIDHFIEQHEKGYGILLGASGVGKTALFCKMYSQKKRNHFWYFYQEEGETNTPEHFYQSLLMQFKKRFQLKFLIPNNLKELSFVFAEIVEAVAKRLAEEGSRCVLFVDGLNEVKNLGTQETILEYLPHLLPANTLILLALQSGDDLHFYSRHLLHIQEKIEAIVPLYPMEGLRFEDFSEALHPFQKRPSSFQKRSLKHLFKNASGAGMKLRPLYLALLQRVLQNSQEELQRPYRLPLNEQEAFQVLWSRLPIQEQGIHFRYLAFLSILKEKGRDDLFCRLFHKSEDYIHRLVQNHLSPFLQQDEQGYQIFHRQLREHIQDQFSPQEWMFFHKALADFYDKPKEQEWFQVENNSTFYYLTYHLYCYFELSKENTRLLEVITDPLYNREKEKRIDIFQYLLDELRYAIQLFLENGDIPNLIRYGFKYINTKNNREKGLKELPHLLKTKQYERVSAILDELDSVQSKRLGTLYLASLYTQEQDLQLQLTLKKLIPQASFGAIHELKPFYFPLVKKIVASRGPAFLHFIKGLPQPHLKILELLPNPPASFTPALTAKFIKHINFLTKNMSQGVALYQSILHLLVCSARDEVFEGAFQQFQKERVVFRPIHRWISLLF